MARMTNAQRKAKAAGVVVEEVKVEEVKAEAAPAPAPEKKAAPAPEVKKPARVVKKASKKEEILGDDAELEDKTVAELRDIASDIDVEGRSGLTKKADLIEGIKTDDDWTGE